MNARSIRSWVQRRDKSRDRLIPESDKVALVVAQTGPQGITRFKLGRSIKLNPHVLNGLLDALVNSGPLTRSWHGEIQVFHSPAANLATLEIRVLRMTHSFALLPLLRAVSARIALARVGRFDRTAQIKIRNAQRSDTPRAIQISALRSAVASTASFDGQGTGSQERERGLYMVNLSTSSGRYVRRGPRPPRRVWRIPGRAHR